MKPTIARTYAIWPDGAFNVVGTHIKANAIQRRFKKLAKIYCGLHKCQVYTEDSNGIILYNTNRGDWVPPEVGRVKRSKDPVLLVGQIKTEAGLKALEERLRDKK